MALDRNQLMAQVMGACNRLGMAYVMAHIKKTYGLKSGYARDLTTDQLLEVQLWCYDRLLEKVPTLKQIKDAEEANGKAQESLV